MGSTINISADQIVKSLEPLSFTSFTDESERTLVRDALQAALRRVQTPWEIVWEQNWIYGATYVCVKTFIDAGVFEKWIESGGGPRTSAELAALTGVEEQLVRRLIRHLATQALVNEVAQDTYSPTPWVHMVASPKPPIASIYGKFFSDLNVPVFNNTPLYLRDNGYRNPTDGNDANMQHWTRSKTTFFEYIKQDPELLRHFHDTMECHAQFSWTPWFTVYPAETIVANAKPGRPLVVDVGGSKGHDLERFRTEYPDIPDGSLILQDVPDIIDAANVDKTISPQVYDFFTPQPVQGATVYFMHSVLHDWDDKEAVKILRNVSSGMEKGYSKLLIHENLVPNVRPLPNVTTSDITMLSMLAAKERSESEWRQLIEDAGLRLVKIWRPAHSTEGVIEAELI